MSNENTENKESPEKILSLPKSLQKKLATLTPRQRKAFLYMAENGGTWADALRHAQYSEEVISNPKKVTGSAAFQECLTAAGFTLPNVSKMYRELATASDLKTFDVPYGLRTKKAKGRKRLQHVYYRLSHDEIKAMFKDMDGFKVSYIADDDVARIHRVMCWVPDRNTRQRATEMTSKALKVLETDKFSLLLEHTVSPTEKEDIDDVFGGNNLKKK